MKAKLIVWVCKNDKSRTISKEYASRGDAVKAASREYRGLRTKVVGGDDYAKDGVRMRRVDQGRIEATMRPRGKPYVRDI